MMGVHGSPGERPSGWFGGVQQGWGRRRLERRLIFAYLAVGAVISVAENVWGAVASGPTVFAWTGSLAGNAKLLWWWLIVPALTWPVDVYWTHDRFAMGRVISAESGIGERCPTRTLTRICPIAVGSGWVAVYRSRFPGHARGISR